MITLEMETHYVLAAKREMFEALRAGDADTARLAREELEAIEMHSDRPLIRRAARRALDCESAGPAVLVTLH